MSNKTPHPADIFAGKQLLSSRKEAGLSQGELALAIGITTQQVSKYERALNRISVSRICDFADILRVSPDYFFEGCVKSKPPALSSTQRRIVERITVADEATVLLVDALICKLTRPVSQT